MTRKTLFLTARDPASAQAILPLLPRLKNHFQLLVYCQEPALSILNAQFSICQLFPPIESFEEGTDMVKNLLSELAVDLVLTGVSGPGFGVDEMTLAAAKALSIRSFAIQSAWGTLNQETGAEPDVALVLDEAAIEINQQYFPQMKSVAVGSLQHAKYAELSPINIRELNRPRFVEEETDILIGFYGQPIAELEGYQQTLETFCQTLKQWSKSFKLLYRPHPKEMLNGVQDNPTWQRIQYHFPLAILDPFQEVTTSLCCVDLVVSAFSTCCFDGLYLNELENKPFNTSVFLWFNNDLIRWATNCSDTQDLHLVKEKLVLAVDSSEQLLTVLESGLKSEQRMQLWQTAREKLPSAKQAVSLVLKALENE